MKCLLKFQIFIHKTSCPFDELSLGGWRLISSYKPFSISHHSSKWCIHIFRYGNPLDEHHNIILGKCISRKKKSQTLSRKNSWDLQIECWKRWNLYSTSWKLPKFNWLPLEFFTYWFECFCFLLIFCLTPFGFFVQRKRIYNRPYSTTIMHTHTKKNKQTFCWTMWADLVICILVGHLVSIDSSETIKAITIKLSTDKWNTLNASSSSTEEWKKKEKLNESSLIFSDKFMRRTRTTHTKKSRRVVILDSSVNNARQMEKQFQKLCEFWILFSLHSF